MQTRLFECRYRLYVSFLITTISTHAQCTEEFLDNEPPPHEALRCMLLREELLVSRHVGFASITDGMVVLVTVLPAMRRCCYAAVLNKSAPWRVFLSF